ncbi:MAG: fumarylacetoacetate hydrolase [Dehalococcoidia bacterium]|nr:fumarylacetoacetate hydrolase [Dehalococcoidia bacterium]
MKLLLFNDERFGVLTDRGIVDATDALARFSPRSGEETMEAAIANWDEVKGELEAGAQSGDAIPLDSVRLLPPLPRPPKVMCMGANYKENGTRPISPRWGFLKNPEAVIGPDGTLVLPKFDANIFHHEAELVVVIGKSGKDIDRANALDHVFGYTVGVDGSAREGTTGSNGGGTRLGKNFDTFAPLGPWIVTKDELDDPHDLAVRLSVDGELRGDFNTDDMAHQIPESIEFFASFMTFRPGDLLFTGTNHQGLGAMQDGDYIEVEIEKVGKLGFHVSDPLKRKWERGVDKATARAVRENAGAPGASARPS